jgi:RHS repeat-associated protein
MMGAAAIHFSKFNRDRDIPGAVVGEHTYEPFGATTVTGTASTPYQFTGRENDGLAGLYYYRARYYRPGLQRFIAEDPIGLLAGDTNYYIYVGNNPVNLIDPFGLDKEKPSCLSRHRFASLFAGTSLESVVTIVEVTSLTSLAGDLAATGVKATRTEVGGPKQAYASGMNAVFRRVGRAIGSRALTGTLVTIGNVATPVLAVTGTFLGAYDATILLQCSLGIIE